MKRYTDREFSRKPAWPLAINPETIDHARRPSETEPKYVGKGCRYAATESSSTVSGREAFASGTSRPLSNTKSKNHTWSTLPRLISCGWFFRNRKISFSRMR